MTVKRCLLLLILIALSAFGSSQARAYSPDIHFSLTYVLCRLAGIPVNDALWIAAADQSMDDNISTTAFPSVFGVLEQRAGNDTKKVYARNGRLFHAFSDAGHVGNVGEDGKPGDEDPFIPSILQYTDGGAQARKAIVVRRDELQKRVPAGLQTTVSEKDRITADIAFGQFLHYSQDYYSHRQLTPDRDNNSAYLPYGSYWGHALNGVKPDEVVRYPSLAKVMAANSYGYICGYAKSAFGKAPNRSLSLDSLIDAIAKSYPASYGKSKPPTVNYEFPSSKQVNGLLTPCLAKNFRAVWPGPATLPFYTDHNWNLVLPYDHPKLPMKGVVKNFREETARLTAHFSTTP